MYEVTLSKNAENELYKLSRSHPNLVRKFKALLKEIIEHPRTCTSRVEALKGYDGTVYSQRLNEEHRLVYRIDDENMKVVILSTYGHYTSGHLWPSDCHYFPKRKRIVLQVY